MRDRYGMVGERRRLAGLAGSVGRAEQLEQRMVFSAGVGVDPVTPDNPAWFIPRGSATIDGVLDDA
ncbi:MAG: hypothetical protein AAF747_07665, partial [Planctomycetota bacterium]